MPVLDVTYKAYRDLSSYQFSAVYLRSDGTVDYCPASGSAALGILQDNPSAAGQHCVVREFGHSKARMITASGAIGDPLKVGDAYGRFTTGVLGTNVIIAIAMEAWTTTGQIIEVALTARTAQGTTSRAGVIPFTLPIKRLATTGALITTGAIGFPGKVVDMYAIADTTCAATTTSTAALSLKLGAAGTTAVTGLSIPVSVLTEANVEAIGTVMTGTGTPGVNTFAATDFMTVYVTQGSTTFGGSDTGNITLYVVVT